MAPHLQEALVSRSEEFHGARLFHGTDAELNPGDIVEPRANYRTLREAYATDNIRNARYFGEHVYEVAPVDPSEHLGPNWMDQYDDEPRMREYTSSKGFTVVRKVRGKKSA